MPHTVLTVFLSSTAEDLISYREATHARINATEYFRCVDATDAHAPDDLDAHRERAQKADLFVGLLGLQRGWEPAGDSYERSITEMEHDWAEAAGRTRFLFVSPDDFFVRDEIDESDARHHRQQGFRRRLLSEPTMSQAGFSSPHLLSAFILEELLRHLIDAELDQLMTPAPRALGKAQNTLPSLPDETIGKLLAIFDARGDTERAEQAGISRQTVFELACRLKPEEVRDIDQALIELNVAVDIAADIVNRGKRGGHVNNIINADRARIATLMAAGNIEGAAREADRGFAEWRAASPEWRRTALQSGIAILEAGLEQDILRRDVRTAAERLQTIVGLAHAGNSSAQFEALRQRADGFLQRGRACGSKLDLLIAIEIAKLTAHLAQNADQRGEALNDLGVFLATLGERETNPERLHVATQAFRAALIKYPRQQVPLEWALTKNNLGNALRALGERDTDKARLNEAIDVFREALEECTRETEPLDWAMIQNNLGNALRALGERESGSAHLEAAVNAFRRALTERTRERVPLRWAATQHNLGNALQILGERESGTARLRQAVEAYREALKERTRKHGAQHWAITQNSLGNALLMLGEREDSTVPLQEAVAAYRAALGVFEARRAGSHINLTHRNLARAEKLLADWQGSWESLANKRNPMFDFSEERKLGQF